MQETMKAVVYHGPNKISLDDVPVPKLMYPDDAIVKVTTSTICDNRYYRSILTAE